MINSSRNIFLTAYFMLVFSSLSFAQKIYVCDSVTDRGVPIDAKPGWELLDDGTTVVILFDNGKEITNSLLYLFIDKKRGDTFEPFDSKAVMIEKNATWVSYEHTFTSEGVYSVYFINTSNKKLAQYQVTFYKINKPEDVEIRSFKPRYFSSNYYSDMVLTYCQKVVSDVPVNPRNYTSLSKDGGEIYVHLNNYKPMQTDTLFVEIWFKEPDWDNYSELVDSKKFKLNRDWANTFFRYVFEKTGRFKFEIFDQRNALVMSTPAVTVYE